MAKKGEVVYSGEDGYEEILLEEANGVRLVECNQILYQSAYRVEWNEGGRDRHSQFAEYPAAEALYEDKVAQKG